MRCISYLIPDLEVHSSETALAAVLDNIDHDLTAGRNVILHCRAGIGRSGLVASCLLVMKGVSPEEAVKKVARPEAFLFLRQKSSETGSINTLPRWPQRNEVR